MMFLPEKRINAKVRTVSRLTSLHAGLSEPKQEYADNSVDDQYLIFRNG